MNSFQVKAEADGRQLFMNATHSFKKYHKDYVWSRKKRVINQKQIIQHIPYSRDNQSDTH